MKILFDTNIILDVLLHREPFFQHSATLVSLAEVEKVKGWICGTSVTTIHYLVAKALSTEEAERHISSILKIFHVSSVNRAVLFDALESDFDDFEVAVIYQSAIHSQVEGILSRNTSDFKKSSLPAYNPSELLSALEIL